MFRDRRDDIGMFPRDRQTGLHLVDLAFCFGVGDPAQAHQPGHELRMCFLFHGLADRPDNHFALTACRRRAGVG